MASVGEARGLPALRSWKRRPRYSVGEARGHPCRNGIMTHPYNALILEEFVLERPLGASRQEAAGLPNRHLARASPTEWWTTPMVHVEPKKATLYQDCLFCMRSKLLYTFSVSSLASSRESTMGMNFSRVSRLRISFTVGVGLAITTCLSDFFNSPE